MIPNRCWLFWRKIFDPRGYISFKDKEIMIPNCYCFCRLVLSDPHGFISGNSFEEKEVMILNRYEQNLSQSIWPT